MTILELEGVQTDARPGIRLLRWLKDHAPVLALGFAVIYVAAAAVFMWLMIST